MAMHFRKSALALLLIVLLLPAANALANKSAVAIVAPDAVEKGAVITIKLNVTHSANNMFHHTNWLYLVANGKEVARWEFGPFSLPESADFTREFKLVVDGPVQLEAQSNCNIHGSAGKVFHTVNLK